MDIEKAKIVNRKELDKLARVFSDDMAIFRQKHKVNDGELFLILDQYIMVKKNLYFMKAYEKTI